MNILFELSEMAKRLASGVSIPQIKDIYFPPFIEGGQPAGHEFMIMTLESGAGGLSYVLIPNEYGDNYRSLKVEDFIGTSPLDRINFLDSGDPVNNMIGLGAVNAVCQHMMRLNDDKLDLATDSIGLIDIHDGDTIGMVGLFRPLLKYAENFDIEFIIIEKNKDLIEKYPDFNITLDVSELNRCNKVLCTGTTVLNNTLDNILSHCSGAEHLTVLGPTTGFFPDPLFARGIDVVGGRYVENGDILLERIKKGERWGDATKKLCFQRKKFNFSRLNSY